MEGLPCECGLLLLEPAGNSFMGITLVGKLQKHSSRSHPFSLGHIKEVLFSNHNESEHFNAWLELIIKRPLPREDLEFS